MNLDSVSPGLATLAGIPEHTSRETIALPSIRPSCCIVSRRPEPAAPKPNLMETKNVNEAEIEAKVIDIVAEQMGVEKGEITRDTSFTNDLNADSLDTVELVMEFEDEFDTTIPDEQAEKINTVGSAIEYIKSHMGG